MITAFVWLFIATASGAEGVRIAVFNVELERDGPGLLLRDIRGGKAPDAERTAAIIAHVAPDVLVLTGFDYDAGGHALAAFVGLVADAGHDPGEAFALLPNSGLDSGRDLDGDGQTGRPRDALGYGEFAGQGGMAILSRFPIDRKNVRDLSAGLWRDLPGALIEGDDHLDIRRLSTVAHWIVPIVLPDGSTFDLLTWHATPPVFDGPEDLNGRRNHDETRIWTLLVDGKLATPAPQGAFVLAGDANLDPLDGDGRTEAITELLAHRSLRDPKPKSDGGAEAAVRDGGRNASHRGDPRLDTADWRDGDGDPGNLRVDYVLPSIHWRLLDSGVFWPMTDAPLARLLGEGGNEASRHRLVWVDLMLERGADRLVDGRLGEIGQ